VAKYHNPDTGWKGTLIGLAVIVGLAYGGWRAYKHFFVGAQNAVITDMRLFGDGIEVMLWFKEPPSGDVGDVTLVLTSEALNEDIVLEWPDICKAAYPAGVMPEDEPPLDEEIVLRIGLKKHLRWGMQIDHSDAFINAKLSWGGRQQDTGRANIFALVQ
jgi:hypothetical protein